jgi:hypothetical protein
MSSKFGDSNFFVWLQKKMGITKPMYMEFGGWAKWHTENKNKNKLAYWMTETLPSKIDWVFDLLIDPINEGKYYLVNRFVIKTHTLPTNLKKGAYWDSGTKMLHGCFDTLVDFIEVECANHHMMWSSTDQEKYKYPRRMKYWLTDWYTWRSPESGVAYLYWNMSLDDPMVELENRHPPQAESARITFKLYYWWKYERPIRNEPYTDSKLDEFYALMESKYDGGNWLFSRGKDEQMNAEEKAEYQRLVGLQDQLEKDNLATDEEMLTLLISHRLHLWT